MLARILNVSFFIFVLAFLVNVQDAIAADKISLVHMVPGAWIDGIKAWNKFLLYCGNSLIMLLAAPRAFTKMVMPAAKAVLFFALALIASLFLVMAQPANAQTASTPALAPLPVALPVKAPLLPASSPCVINNCTGWYAGVGLTGNGTNADIVGSGLNQSIFAAGGQLDIHGGYQFWNGKYFAAAEVGLGYQFQNGAIAVSSSNLTGYELIKFGGSLSGLFNTNSSAVGQSPITIPQALAEALISPYFAIGAIQRNGVSQWATGAGADFLLATNWDLDLRYLYAPAVNNVKDENLITLGLNRHF